jgi:hypothetical protein
MVAKRSYALCGEKKLQPHETITWSPWSLVEELSIFSDPMTMQVKYHLLFTCGKF